MAQYHDTLSAIPADALMVMLLEEAITTTKSAIYFKKKKTDDIYGLYMKETEMIAVEFINGEEEE